MKENIVTCKDIADAKMQTSGVKKLFAWHHRREQTKQMLKTAHQNDKHLKIKMSVAQR